MVDIAESWSSLAIANLKIGLLVIDKNGRICLFNQALSRLTGITEDEVIGQPLNTPNKLLQTLTTGKEFQDLNPRAVLPFTSLANYLTSTQLIRDKSGYPVGAAAVFMPAERQHELEGAVIKAEKLAILGQMAAEMVHEIRNPLTVIGGFLTLLQKDLTGTPKEKHVSIIRAELEHVNNLISDFLQFSRPGYAKRTRCSIVQIITDVTMLVENEASLRKLEINLDLAGDIPDIFGDSDQLKQVFLNIFKNAFEALSFGGKIFVQSSWNSNERIVQVIIRDTGMGMDKQTMTSMFNPFFTTKENGTGLGLFIIKKIIENHGGKIEIQSEPGKGTIVTVLLPAG
ncbi:Sporulation kinase E [Sporotomaculum syntrophicum]|uniref:histidine kinase n=1 Tax=Sporotomaculum syntrophicum TaxID=182264 RepID=A0A9D3AYP9_9FIRM|nr:ATP-binding protein [Sporotomaculum syntrophicum]KAF1085034.1 Sporulation kinase E [Sporotomaculum syntrophicum]